MQKASTVMHRPGSWRLFLLICASLLLGACATGPVMMRTQLTSYNEWPADIEKTYTFVAPAGTERSLEQRAHERLVADELARQGFREIADGVTSGGARSDPASARLAITVRAAITAQELRVVEPVMYDPWWPRRFDPMWASGGAWGAWREVPLTVHRRSLHLEIDDRGADRRASPPHRLYEGTVTSQGSSDALDKVLPYLVRALFVDFPGINGQTRAIDVPVD